MSTNSPGSFTYPYPRPALTVDLILLTREPSPRVLLIQRKHEPFQGRWALPGGFVDEGETLETAARRELQEETGVTVSAIEQFGTYGDPGRDPRGWTVSVVYLVRVEAEELSAQAGDDAAEVAWFALTDLPLLAFDHRQILTDVTASL